MRFFLSIICCLMACSAVAPPEQKAANIPILPVETMPYPQGFFASPIGEPVDVGATFGELRPNHFHSGLDIRPPRGNGHPQVLAAADGYVSRISVHGGGYGIAIYVTHSNGFTTLYGHIDRLSDKLQQYLRTEQYARQTFDVELTPDPNWFPLRQGQPLGIMGNTGHSTGTHLHFEVRKTDGNIPLNPLLFGLPTLTDRLPPSINELKLYELDGSGKKIRSQTYKAKLDANGYRLADGDTIYVNSSQINVAIKAYDKAQSASDHNGIYALQMFQNENSQPSFGFSLDEIPFNESLYVNALCDFESIKNGGGYFNRCHRLPGNYLKSYTQTDNDGLINVSLDQPTKLTFVAKDFAGNYGSLECWVKYLLPDGEPLVAPEPVANYWLKYDEENMIRTDNFTAYFPKGALYEALPMRLDVLSERSSRMFSPVYRLHSSLTPLHLPIDISIAPSATLPPELLEKTFIASCGSRGYVNCGGEWKNGKLAARVRYFGEYCIMTDETPPTIRKNIVYKTVGRGRKRKKIEIPNPTRLSFRISDNMGSSKESDGLKFNAFVDEQWILMEYDSKRSLLFYNFKEGRVAAGEHRLKIVLKDAVGNETIYEENFYINASQLPTDDVEEEEQSSSTTESKE